jgi:hypothetical protein
MLFDFLTASNSISSKVCVGLCVIGARYVWVENCWFGHDGILPKRVLLFSLERSGRSRYTEENWMYPEN